MAQINDNDVLEAQLKYFENWPEVEKLLNKYENNETYTQEEARELASLVLKYSAYIAGITSAIREGKRIKNLSKAAAEEIKKMLSTIAITAVADMEICKEDQQ